MTAQDRLKKFIAYKGLTLSAFERICGLGNGFVSKVGDSIRREKLNLISNAFPELNIDWVINEKGEMLSQYVPKTYPMDLRREDDGTADDYVYLLPVEAMAGSLQGFSTGIALKDCRKIKAPVDGSDWAIQISGDSMEPEYKNGSYLYIKKLSGAFIPWGNTIVVDTIDGVVVKNIFPVEGTEEFIEARSINPKYPPFRIETSCILGMYRVLGGSFINSTM